MVALPRRTQTPRTSRIATRTADSGARPPSRSRGSPERDVRRLERLCASLEQQAARAKEAELSLFRAISHDVANPLTPLKISMTFLAREIPAGQPARRYVDTVNRCAEELAQLIENITDAGRIDTGLLLVSQESRAVAPIIKDALQCMQPSAEHRGVTLSCQIAEGTPAVFADRARITKALTNLVSNAMKFLKSGSSITVRAEANHEGVLFSVADTGPGLAEDQRSHTFTIPPKERSRSVQGEGYLPYVARGIIEAHGGRIWMESKVGRGSTFFFTLPAGDEPIDDDQPLN